MSKDAEAIQREIDDLRAGIEARRKQLARYVRNMRLCTTREARQRNARKAGNIQNLIRWDEERLAELLKRVED